MWPKYIFFIYNFYKKRNFIFFNSTNFTVLEQAHYHSSLGVITSRCWGKNCKYCSFYCLFLHIKFVALYRCFIHYNFHTVYKEMFGPVLFSPSLSVDKFQYYFSWNATVSEKLFASAEGEHYN